jgi:hypothetical protein
LGKRNGELMNLLGSEPVKPEAILRWYCCRVRILVLFLLIGTMLFIAIPYALQVLALATYDPKPPRPPPAGWIWHSRANERQWKRTLDFPVYADGYEITVLFADFDDAFLEMVNPRQLSPVRATSLEGAHVTDAGLRTLRRLDQLLALDLDGTNVADDGLENLETLTQLRWLSLRDTRISDAGLQRLRGLTQLEWLDLGNTEISDAGLVSLARLAKLQVLGLAGTDVSDDGLQHLRELMRLDGLDLSRTKVTEDGVNEFKEARPNCRVFRLQTVYPLESLGRKRRAATN